MRRKSRSRKPRRKDEEFFKKRHGKRIHQNARGFRSKRFSRHHIRPRSRGGTSSKYNIFPWEDIPHRSDGWHRIMRHMTLQEIWPNIDKIYRDIFLSGKEYIIPLWWGVLPLASHERSIEQYPIPVSIFRKAWSRAFHGTSSLDSAKNLIKCMMLWLVFDGNLGLLLESKVGRESRTKNLIKKIRTDSDRVWAFHQCFGLSPGKVRVSHMRRVAKHILSASPYKPPF